MERFEGVDEDGGAEGVCVRAVGEDRVGFDFAFGLLAGGSVDEGVVHGPGRGKNLFSEESEERTGQITSFVSANCGALGRGRR